MASYRVASIMGCTVEELDDRMTYREFLDWCNYLASEEERTQKYEYYMARMLAMMQAQLNPKGRYTATEFLIGTTNKRKGGFRNLRDASAEEVKSIFRALPFAKFTEAPTNG